MLLVESRVIEPFCVRLACDDSFNNTVGTNQRRVVRVMYVINNAFESKSGQSHMSVFHTMG